MSRVRTLAVMFGVAHMAPGAVLHAFHALRLPAIQAPIGQCPVFHLIDMCLLAFQPSRFGCVDAAAGDTVVDALFLPFLSDIDAVFHALRRGRCRCVLRQHGTGQRGDQGGQNESGFFHDELQGECVPKGGALGLKRRVCHRSYALTL